MLVTDAFSSSAMLAPFSVIGVMYLVCQDHCLGRCGRLSCNLGVCGFFLNLKLLLTLIRCIFALSASDRNVRHTFIQRK